jgi:hypothetical protein
MMNEFLLCVALSEYVEVDLQTYPVYDFGRVSISGKEVSVRPLHLTTTYLPASNQVCALIALPRSISSAAFAPIIRLANDESLDGVALTSGQKACLYIIATFFAIAAGIWVILMVQMVRVKAFVYKVPSCIVWIGSIALFCQRSIYLYLVASNVLDQPNNNQLVDYFMMDFPMCLYLIINFQVGLSFFFMQQKHRDLTRFWVVFSVGAFFILMIFISTLLAFRYQVLNQPGISGPLLCPVYYDATHTARVIRLIYQAIVLFVSLCIGLTEFVAGSSLYSKIRKTTGSSRILILGITCSLGIISDSVAFLVYYIVDSPHPYFSIVLIFTEIIPIMVLLFQLKTTAVKHACRSYPSSSQSHTRQSAFTPTSAE